MMRTWLAMLGGQLTAALRSKPLLGARTLLFGKGAQSACSAIYLMLAARALGPAHFGMLVLVHGFTLGLADLVNFQSWQAIVRYGAMAIEADDHARMRRLLHFSIGVDALGALIAVALILGSMPWMARLFDLPPEAVPVARIYGLAVIPLIFSSTSVGVLRLCQRFDRLAVLIALPPLVRLVGTLWLYVQHGTLTSFLWVWLVSTVVGRVGQTWFAWHELRARNMALGVPRLFAVARGPEPGIWRFVLGTNIGSTLDLASSQLGTLAVGFVLGPAGAGFYRVAQQFSNMLIKPNTKLLIPALYPEMARLTARGEVAQRNRMVMRLIGLIALLATVVFAVLWLAGPWLIRVCFGAAYAAVYTPMLWLSAAGLLGVLSMPIEPMLIAAGRLRVTVMARLAATLVYVGALAMLMPPFGLHGAGMAAAMYALLVGLLFYAGALHEWRRPRRHFGGGENEIPL